MAKFTTRPNPRFVQKFIKNISHVITTTQDNTTLVSSVERETVVGMKGILNFIPEGTTAGKIAMAIIRLPNGTSQPGLDTADLGEILGLVSDVLWSFLLTIDADGDETISIPLDIKTSRKMREGDSIVLSTLGTAANVVQLASAISTFIKEA